MRGCDPKKILRRGAEIIDSARLLSGKGIDSDGLSINWADLMKHKHGFTDPVPQSMEEGLSRSGVTTLHGRAKFTGARQLEIGGTAYDADRFLVATGARPRPLEFPGHEHLIDSTDFLDLEEVPSRILFVGGGFISFEFAHIAVRAGSAAIIIDRGERPLKGFDPDLVELLVDHGREVGIDLRRRTSIVNLHQSDTGYQVTLEHGGAQETIETDLVLVAVGRGPNGNGNGFEEAGVTVDRGWVPTDERLRTNVPGVFAVGDLVPGLQLAHRGFAHGIFVAEEIAGLSPQPVLDPGIPRVTYCDPELASVGITEPQAKEKYGDENVETVEYNLGGNGKSQILGTAGVIKLVREKDGPIVGVHMIGARYGEQVGEASLIVNWEAYPEDVAQLIHAHPTQNEALGEAALALAGKPLHSHA